MELYGEVGKVRLTDVSFIFEENQKVNKYSWENEFGEANKG